MSPPLEHVSGLVHPHQREQIAAVGGDRGLSAGLRDVVGAGLCALRGDAALIHTVDELQQLARQLATISGRRSPAGGWWAPTPEALPSAEMLDPGGDVMVMPHSVGLIGDGALVIDLEQREIVAHLNSHEARITVDLQELAGPAAILPAALAGLAAAGPGRRELGLGLAVERTGDDLCRLTLQGIGAACQSTVAQTFAAELLGLIARAARASAAARAALNRQLEEVAS